MAVTMSTEDEWQLYCQEKGDLAKLICLLEEFHDVWAEKRPWKTIGQILFHSQTPHPVCPSKC
jgi:hypothetical protein